MMLLRCSEPEEFGTVVRRVFGLGISGLRKHVHTSVSGGEGPEMVVINSGILQTGCLTVDDYRDEELTVLEVSVVKFAISNYEVTFAAFDQFVNATYHRHPDDFGWGLG
ncbi:MAG: formylglycine-generating enzyme family protein [Gammaproteobacteria bacterium]|nr:formylglycine-generating enzyme family protein [Gammaproteobacteria bacterium]